MSSDFFRCQNASCGRKWHPASLEYERGRATKPRPDLFAAPKETSEDGCPACGGRLEPERGSLCEESA
jgi:hypothetical protein